MFDLADYEVNDISVDIEKNAPLTQHNIPLLKTRRKRERISNPICGKGTHSVAETEICVEYNQEQIVFQKMARSFWDARRAEEIIPPVNNLKNLRDQIVGLARLAPDWYGEGSVVPEQKVIDDFMQVLTSLPYNVEMPEIEIDDDSVSLEWGAKDGNASFALDCSGTGNVVGTLLSKNKSQQQAWRLKVRDYNDLANKIAIPLIHKILIGEL